MSGRKPQHLNSIDKLDRAADELLAHLRWKIARPTWTDGVPIKSLGAWGLTRGWRRDYLEELLSRLEERNLVGLDPEHGQVIAVSAGE